MPAISFGDILGSLTRAHSIMDKTTHTLFIGMVRKLYFSLASHLLSLSLHSPTHSHITTTFSPPTKFIVFTVTGPQFQKEHRSNPQLYAILFTATIGTTTHSLPTTLPNPITELLQKYHTIAPKDLPDTLPLLRSIQHHIDFHP